MLKITKEQKKEIFNLATDIKLKCRISICYDLQSDEEFYNLHVYNVSYITETLNTFFGSDYNFETFENLLNWCNKLREKLNNCS